MTKKNGNLDHFSLFVSLKGSDVGEIQIDKKMTIGAEVGDYIDPTLEISPRHCTLICSKNIISVIDHNSHEGTWINKKQIDPGKMYIISENDKLRLGNHSLIISKKTIDNSPEDIEEEIKPITENIKTADEIEEPKDFTSKEEKEESVSEPKPHGKDYQEFTMHSSGGLKLHGDKTSFTKTIKNLFSKKNSQLELDDVDLYEEENQEKTLVASDLKGAVSTVYSENKDKKSSKKKVKSVRIKADPSANAINRIIANIFDFCLTLSLLQIIPSEFLIWVEDVQDLTLKGFAIIEENEIFDKVINDYPFLSKIWEDLNPLDHLNQILLYSCSFLVIKFGTALIFGVSIGQLFAGIRNQEDKSFIVKRMVYPIREFFGLITFSFLIFDLPTLISKRPLKEVLFRVQLQTKGFLGSFVSIILGCLIFSGAYFMAPFFKDFYLYESFSVQEVGKPLRKVVSSNETYIEGLGINIINSDGISFFPAFEVKKLQDKTIIKSGLKLFDIDKKSSLTIVQDKKIDLNYLIDGFVKNNPLSPYFYKHIYDYAKDISKNNANFISKDEKKSKLYIELSLVIKQAYELSLFNFHEHALNYGPNIAGHRFIRDELTKIFGTEFSSIELLRFGQKNGLLLSKKEGREHKFFFFPFDISNEYIYKLSLHPYKGLVRSLSSRVSFESNKKDGQTYLVLTQILGNMPSEDSIMQGLFESYFDYAKLLISSNYEIEKQDLLKSLSSLLRILELNPDKNKTIILKLNELKQAVIDEQLSFFNLDNITV